MTEATGEIRLDVEGHVGTITIDRPSKLNAITVAMDEQLNELVHKVNVDQSIFAVVITGAGERAFSVGSDLGDLDAYGDSWTYRNRVQQHRDYALGLWQLRVPVVAAIDGYCIGGGLELACASDLRVVTSRSSFGAGEIRWGWHGGSGATQFLTRLVGRGQASRLLLTGERIDGDEAYRIGLAEELVAPDQVNGRAQELANVIASRGPIAVQSAKNLIRVAQSTSIDIGLAYENDMFAYLMGTEDAAEGRAAFAEKRDPEFKGR